MLLNAIIIVSFTKVRWPYDSIFVSSTLKKEAALLRNVDVQFKVSKQLVVINSVIIVSFAKVRWPCDLGSASPKRR
jgi:hypothetical protein